MKKYLLLNPHGSDETERRMLYVNTPIFFLTHTVQMKLSSMWWESVLKISLLNPHGSDETEKWENWITILQNFLTHTVQMKLSFTPMWYILQTTFLTHTVQMKPLLDKIRFIELEFLLNPHGSDETTLTSKMKSPYTYFLTHTVQMKPEITTPNII